MATRRLKRSDRGTAKKTEHRTTKPAAKRGAKPAGHGKAKAAPAREPRSLAGAAAGRRAAGQSLLDEGERIAEAITRSKLTAADPWTYTAKARVWQRRVQELMAQIARDGETAALRQKLDALRAEVEGDRDFREARRLF